MFRLMLQLKFRQDRLLKPHEGIKFHIVEFYQNQWTMYTMHLIKDSCGAEGA